MKCISKVELKVDGYDKCSLILDSDCPLGQIHDYLCAARSFVVEKIKEAEEVQKQVPASDPKIADIKQG